MSSFYDEPELIGEVDCKLFIMLYRGKFGEKLDTLKHTAYMSMCSTGSSKPLPEKIPTT